MASVKDAEERAVMLRIATVLHSLTIRMNGNVVSGVSQMLNEVALDSPDISVVEAADLVRMISQIVASSTRDPDHLRSLLYEVHPQLVPILLSFLQAPQSASTPGDVFAQFFQGILHCITDIVCGCCVDPNLQEEDGRIDASTEGSWNYLANITARVFVTMDALPMAIALLGPLVPPDVQQAASEFVFALLVRVQEARDIAVQQDCLSALCAAMQEQRNPALRAFVAACIRELANSHPHVMLSPFMFDTLVRLLVLDESPDVRALAAETVETVFRSDPSAWYRHPRTKEIASAILDRLECESVSDSQIACLKLLETLLLLEAATYELEFGTTEAQPQQQQVVFTDYLVSGYGDRLLSQMIDPSSRVGSLAAHCLRLLLQCTSYHRYAAFGLVQHFPSLSKIIKMCVYLATDPSKKDIVSQITRTEIAMTLALCFAQDPRCRQLVSSQMLEHPQYMQQLRAAILHNLNSAALDYFGDVTIIDATGQRITDFRKFEWEPVNRPTKQSVAAIFDQQEERWTSFDADDRKPPVADGPGVPMASRSPEEQARCQRLAFILLSFAAHLALGNNPPNQNVAPSNGASTDPSRSNSYVGTSQGGPFFSAPPQPQPSSVDQQKAAVSGGDSIAEPVPNRSSMLREWSTHPQKFGALQRAMEVQQKRNTSASPTSSRRSEGRPQHALHADPAAAHPSILSTTAAMRPTAARRIASPPRRSAAFEKFECALKLTKQFAQHFTDDNDTSTSRVTIYETSGDGFARRQVSGPSAAGSQQKSWSVAQLKENDLFYFNIPFIDLTTQSLEQARAKAVRHLNVVKKSFIVTPQAAKSRRWFLYDMSTHILPSIIHTMSQLLELFVLHGEETVKFPILMFRESELQAQREANSTGSKRPQTEALPSDASLHSGNLLEILDQVRFYFNRIDQRQTQQQSSASPQRSTYLKDLENKIALLSAQKFDGAPSAAVAGSAKKKPRDLPLSFQYDSDDDN